MNIARIIMLLMVTGFTGFASAVPVNAQVTSCSATACTVNPLGGPVNLDPTGFTLEVDWSPQHIELIEPVDDRGEFLVKLFFTVVGNWDGTEHLGDIVLNEMDGLAITGLNENFDDIGGFAPDLIGNYEVFGPDTLGHFFTHGFDLALSDFSAGPDGVIQSVHWTGAEFSIRQGDIQQGIWSVPEPGTLGLLWLGLVLVGLSKKQTVSRKPQ